MSKRKRERASSTPKTQDQNDLSNEGSNDNGPGKDELVVEVLDGEALENDDTAGHNLSPARDRESDKIVKRATQGLMRRDSRRRVRLYFKRVVIFGAIALILWGLWHRYSDVLPKDQLNEIWEELIEKSLPFYEDQEEAPDGF